jgi:hypothetical protein
MINFERKNISPLFRPKSADRKTQARREGLDAIYFSKEVFVGCKI